MKFKFTHSSDIVCVTRQIATIRINSILLVYTVSNIRAIGGWLILNKFQIQTFLIFCLIKVLWLQIQCTLQKALLFYEKAGLTQKPVESVHVEKILIILIFLLGHCATISVNFPEPSERGLIFSDWFITMTMKYLSTKLFVRLKRRWKGSNCKK